MSNNKYTEQIRQLCSVPEKALRQSPWEDIGFYSEWLAQTAHFVNHSTRLLALSAAHCKDDQKTFHNRFIAHAAEEKNHEKLAILDLKNINLNFKDIPEACATMSLYQPQYYWIQFKSPISFFGYIFCLEMIAKESGPEIYKKVSEIYGPKASHFIKVHAEEDEDHIEHAFKMIHGIEGQDAEYIMQNLKQSCDNYIQLIYHCQAKAQNKYKKAG